MIPKISFVKMSWKVASLMKWSMFDKICFDEEEDDGCY